MATETEKLTKSIDTAVHALAVSVGSIVGDEDLDDDEKASFLKTSFNQYQEHLRELIPSEFSNAITAAVEVAKVKSTAAADEEGQPMKGNQMTQAVHNFVKKYSTSPPDPQAAREIVNIAKAINAGTASGNFASKASWYQVMKRLAEQDRKNGQSSAQAFAAFVQTPDGSELFKAYKNADGPDVEPVAAEVPVIKATPARDEINKLADEFVTADPSLTKYSALLKVHADMPELAAKAKAESFA
jgi:hypothetical protein